jgi:hypothetical protein
VVLLPGASIDVTLTFASSQAGTFNATLMLVGDDPYNADIRIPLTLSVAQRQLFMPIVRR